MLKSTRNRNLVISYLLVISLFGGITWIESSRKQKAEAIPFWVLGSYEFGGPFTFLGAAILAYPFLVFLPQKKKQPAKPKVSDAPLPLMYYISDCALHMGEENGRENSDWTVQQWMEQTNTDCQWADEKTADFGSETWLPPNAFDRKGEADNLAVLADTFCKGSSDTALKEKSQKLCIGTYGINAVPDHYQFVVFRDGHVEWAVHRGAFESYPNYPIVGSGSDLDPNL